MLDNIAHFQKEWQTGARVGGRSIMGSFGGHNCVRLDSFADTSIEALLSR